MTPRSSPRPPVPQDSESAADSRSEYTTAGGLRFVGDAARLVRETAPEPDSLPLGSDDAVLFGTILTVRPRPGAGSAREVILDALGAAVNEGRPDGERLLPDEPLRRPADRFGGLEWDFHLDRKGRWTGELVWRHSHPVARKSACTTQVIVEERKGFTRLAIRITADQGLRSVRGMVGAGQARPAFLERMRERLHFVHEGVRCEPRPLPGREIEDWVGSVLLDEARRVPVAVLAPLEGEPGERDPRYEVDPETLAAEFAGLARLRVIERHEDTFVLSDTLRDRRLSAYWGALRIYLPGFTLADDPHDHPLLVRDRLGDPVMRAAEIGRLGAEMGRRIRMPERVRDRRRAEKEAAAEASHARSDEGGARTRAPTTSAQSAHAPTAPPPTAPAPPAPGSATPGSTAHGPTGPGSTAHGSTAAETTATDPAPPVPAAADATAPPKPARDGAGGSEPPGPATAELLNLGARVAELDAAVGRLIDSQTRLLDEMKRLRTINALRSSNTAALERRLERRLDRIERVLESHLGPDPQPEEDEPAGERETDPEPSRDGGRPSLVDVVRRAVEAHPQTLLFLDSAEASASESPYEDPERVAVLFDAMAHVAEKRQDGALGTSLNDAFRDLGIDYRVGIASSTPARLRDQYLFERDGRVYDCVEHIALGNSYDPRHCLRIYFTSRAPAETRFVIGHVGRHFRTQSTS